MMVFPVGMDCVPTGFTIYDPSNYNMRLKSRVDIDGTEGKHSADMMFPVAPFISLLDSKRRLPSGEIVDLRARSFWGFTHHVSWGTCLSGSIITKAHVLQTSTVTVGQEEWSLVLEDHEIDLAIVGRNSRPPLAQVLPGEMILNMRVVCGWFAYYEQGTHMGVVESVEQDGTFLVDQPFTSKGDSGLPIFNRTGNGHLLVGCNGYFVDRKDELQREKVAGNPPLFGVIKTVDRGASIHTKPCGSEKTRKDIPNILRGRKLGQRSFVAAPNRVVAREIFQALQEFPELAGSCSLETSDATVTDLISPVLSPVIPSEPLML